MTKQLNSSLTFWNYGTTTVNTNCKPNEIIFQIAKFLNKEKKMSDSQLKWFEKFSNSATAFEEIDSYILNNKELITEKRVKTSLGYIFRIACGVSKTAICIESIKDSNTKVVLKYNRISNKTQEAYIEPRLQKTERDFYQQVSSQIAKYDSIRGNEEIEPHLLGIFKYFKRYNAVLEPYVPYISSIEDCCRKVGQDCKTLLKTLEKYGIDDVEGHRGNSGIYKDKVVVLDYGL